MKSLHHYRPVLMSIIALVAVLLGVSHFQAAHAAEGQKPNVYALIVSIGKYRNPDQNLAVSPGAVHLRNILAELKGHCFENVNVIQLIDEQATKENILNGIEELYQAGKDDVVFIFMEGHGSVLTGKPDRHYFIAYDTDSNVEKTGIWVNDGTLFRRIQSERFIFLTGSCFSGGFLGGLKRSRVRGVPTEFLGPRRGRFGISAAQANEVAWITPKYGMSLFTVYVIRGLRGDADQDKKGTVTVQDLYNFVRDNVSRESGKAQNPAMFEQTSEPERTVIRETPVYVQPLEINVKFFHETDDNLVKLLTNESVLKSGAHVGLAFEPKSDCFIQIFWWDSHGNVERVFPNPQYGEGTSQVKAGKRVWLPYKGSEKHWYVLDKNPGVETVYFVATREPNKRLDQLYERLKAVQGQIRAGGREKDMEAQVRETLEEEFGGEVQVMGVEPYIEPVQSQQTYTSKEQLFADMENLVKVSGAEKVHRLQFKHVDR